MREFYLKHKQRILIGFLIVAGIFFIFYWSSVFFTSTKEKYEVSIKTTYEKTIKANELRATIDQNSKTISNMTTGLLSYIQSLANRFRISAKLINLRPVAGTNNNVEHVSLRLESLYYAELIRFVADIERYDNLRVKAISFAPRYDNPKLIDVNMEVIKFQ